jgi:hypothetical protein
LCTQQQHKIENKKQTLIKIMTEKFSDCLIKTKLELCNRLCTLNFLISIL